MCEDMVLKKAIDADFLAMAEENKQLRTGLKSVCALPDIGSTAKATCFTLLRDLAAKKK
jgi:hypothetical protein